VSVTEMIQAWQATETFPPHNMLDDFALKICQLYQDKNK
jgi:hypothetical protein